MTRLRMSVVCPPVSGPMLNGGVERWDSQKRVAHWTHLCWLVGWLVHCRSWASIRPVSCRLLTFFTMPHSCLLWQGFAFSRSCSLAAPDCCLERGNRRADSVGESSPGWSLSLVQQPTIPSPSPAISFRPSAYATCMQPLILVCSARWCASSLRASDGQMAGVSFSASAPRGPASPQPSRAHEAKASPKCCLFLLQGPFWNKVPRSPYHVLTYLSAASCFAGIRSV